MPKDCNALDRIDKSRDFCKENCRWVKKAQGRPVSDFRPSVKQKAKKSLSKPKPICLRIEKDQFNFISKQALRRSLDEGICYNVNDLIREAIVEAFPYKTQKDMFNE